MLKLWLKCSVYVLILTHFFDHNHVFCHWSDYSSQDTDYDIYDAQSIEYERFTNFANSLAQLKAEKHRSRLKRILLWNLSSSGHKMQEGQKSFEKCSHTNCYITYNSKDVINPTIYDAIAFFAEEICARISLPQQRLPWQKYVFVSTDPNERYPMPTNQLDGIFNWTWTYKLDSDLIWVPFVVTDAARKIVAPKINVHWIKRKDMLPVSEDLNKVLRGKSKAAAWFTSECNHPNSNEIYTLKNILHTTYNLNLDIYGNCSDQQCLPENEENCNKIIRRDYYFYIAFEESCSDDYVTEALLRAVKYNAVPIVYGCANYRRFLPDGSYLNAKTLTPVELAMKMNTLINNSFEYVEYFKWTNHYTYRRTTDSAQTDIYCRMCAVLNNATKMNKISVYRNFKDWWNRKIMYNSILPEEEEEKIEEKQKAEEKRKAEEQQKAEKQRKAEGSRKAEEQRKAEESRKPEEQLKAEEKRIVEKQWKVKEKRKQEDQMKIEEQRKVEKQRNVVKQWKLEEKRIAEKQRKAEDKRIPEEQQKIEEKIEAEKQRKAKEKRTPEKKQTAEEKRKAEKQRKAVEKIKTEQQRKAEKKRKAEKQRREEEKRKAKEQRKIEQTRKAEEQRIVEENRKAEEERKAETKQRVEEQQEIQKESQTRQEKQRILEEPKYYNKPKENKKTMFQKIIESRLWSYFYIFY